MTVGDVIRRNARDPEIRNRPFLLFGDLEITHEEYYRESCRYARLFLSLRVPEEPFHVAVLLDNIPEFLFALGGAALAGAVLVGINNTQRGEHLLRDIHHADCQVLLLEPSGTELLVPVRGRLRIPEERILVVTRWQGTSFPFGRALEPLLETVPPEDPGVQVDEAAPLCLVFTSGTTGAPKAVVTSHRRMISTGEYVGNLMGVGREDVGYLAMPLFHANSQQCGFMPALLRGARVGMIRKFSKSQWLSDVRRYGVTYFNYTGKPLAYILTTPRRPDDRENPLRVAYGNEGSKKITDEFAERFGCTVLDGFGASEGGFGFVRRPEDPPGSVGKPPPEIKVLDETGKECPPARFDAEGRILNPDEAIGEIVNTAGIGKFEGYYKNEEATRQRTRGGMYWSGDFGYKDERGYLYFTGRDASWLRVDGENFLARPVEEILQRHPSVYLCCVYGVPDAQAGDRVMATLVLADDAHFDGEEFLRFLRSQPDLSPKWIPTYLRIARDVPRTATNKPLVRELRREKFRLEVVRDPIYWHERADEPYRPFGPDDYERLKAEFRKHGREHLLDL
ncbi:MAG: acyl-CoA synthetase [Candidatus Binatia bacterium]|nr:MAG: acyl-CoA synthetase [Candidatus Binatia bacterium]